MNTQPISIIRLRSLHGSKSGHPPLSPSTLSYQTKIYRGTGGISQENSTQEFLPAFLDTQTGEVCLSCWPNGSPAPLHLLDGLPRRWITARTETGRVSAIKPSVIAGFMRQGHFYTRQEAAALVGC